MINLTRRQRRFLAAMYPAGTVSMGSETGKALYHMDLVMVAKWGRYGLTPRGKAEIERYPESLWNVEGKKNDGRYSTANR